MNRTKWALGALGALGVGCHDLSYTPPCASDPGASPECPGYVGDAASDGAPADGALDTSMGVDSGADAATLPVTADGTVAETATDAEDAGDTSVTNDSGDTGESGDASAEVTSDAGADSVGDVAADADSAVDAPPSCTGAGPASQACGKCGTQTRACVAPGTYGAWSACGGEGACAPGDVQSATAACAGALENATQTCSAACTWGPSVCALPKGWTKIADPPAGFAARAGASAVWTGDKMIVWGGTDANSTYLSDGAIYDPQTNTWTVMPAVPAGASGRDAHGSVWSGAELVIWGGENATSNLSDGLAYSPATNSWRTLTSSSLGARAWLGAVLARSTGEVVVWGGRSSVEQNDGAAYFPPSDNWKPIAAAPIVGRFSPVMVYLAGDVLVWGGLVNQTNPLRDGARLSVASRTWTKLADPPIGFVDRYGIASAPTADGFFAYGGSELVVPYPTHPDGLRYAAGTWSLVPPVPAATISPAPGIYDAVWCGASSCWVWSGAEAFSPTGNPTLVIGGARFDLATNSWEAMPAANAPSPRMLAQVVWTGSFAVVWGGATGATSGARDGAIFVP